MPIIPQILDGTEEDDGLVGSHHNDEISGLDGDDFLAGLIGDDLLDGGNGRDVLVGGAGDDLMIGGDGADRIMAAEGDDTIFGGDGADTFFMHGNAGDHSLLNDSGGIDCIDVKGALGPTEIDLTPGAISIVDQRSFEIPGIEERGSGLELVLLQDLSGSFSDDLSTINGLVDDLIASLSGLASDVKLGAASFIDKPISPFGSSTDHEYRTEIALTSDFDAWKAAVTGLTTGNGNDGPESQLTGLMQTALRIGEVGWGSSGQKIVVLTTDADPHRAGDHTVNGPNDGDDITNGPRRDGTGEDYPEISQVRDALLAAGIIPIFAVTSGVLAEWESVRDEIGFGVVVELSSDSSDIIGAIEGGIEDAATIIENVKGSNFKDTIYGNDADNMIKGRGGNDKISTGKGEDTVYGGAGKDKIEGGGGDDVLNGGNGKDKLTGGGGSDTFVFNVDASSPGRDVLTDFEDGVDLIEIQSASFVSFSDLTISGGANTIVSFGGTEIAKLNGVAPTDISADDFTFVIV